MIAPFLFLILNILLIIYLIFWIIEIANFLIKKMPSLPTSTEVAKLIPGIFEVREGEKKTFVDLGCGSAKVLIAIKKKHPQIEAIGYENLFTRFLLAKIMLFFSGIKAKIFYRDLFQADLTNTDVVFCYLYPNFMENLKIKFEKELKSGAIIIANTFPLPYWKPIEIIITNKRRPNYQKLFVYEKGV